MKNLRLISDTYRQPIVKTSFCFDLKQYAFKGHLEANTVTDSFGVWKFKNHSTLYACKQKKLLPKFKVRLMKLLKFKYMKMYNLTRQNIKIYK